MLKNTIAIILILTGIFGNRAIDYISNLRVPPPPVPPPIPTPYIPDDPTPTPDPTPSPTPPDIVIDIGVEMPSEEILIKVKSISNIVSERQDRVKLAIFNLEFSQRISSYKTTVQKTNDVYTLAAKIFFKDSLVGKYDGLSEGIISLISDTTTNDDHALSQEEKTELSKKFSGLAWSFWQPLQ